MFNENVREVSDGFTFKLKKNASDFIGFGKGCKTLVNSLLGVNSFLDKKYEEEKICRIMDLKKKPDIISDLSTIRMKTSESLWCKIAKNKDFVAGTLPIYLIDKSKDLIDKDELLDIIIEQMENGVGLMTIHPTANKTIFESTKRRMMPITSRGGSMVLKDLIQRDFKGENIYMQILQKIIFYARKYNVILSLGATFRSGNIFDSNDLTQCMEIEKQISLAKIIEENGVGVIIESPGHAKPSDIVEISRKLRKAKFPIMPLGPIPTDISIGMDHISASIGATIMGLNGCADIISTVTRNEHTGGIPTIENTLEAIESAQIAAHIIDINDIKDVKEDFEIAKDRSNNRTCVYGKGNFSCNRCGKLCPLYFNKI